MTEFFVPILTMTALGFLFSTGLVLAYRKLKVEEDPKIQVISEILPQANCGACGYSGCRAFAEAIVKGKAPVTGCPVGGEETATLVAETLGVDAGEMIKMVARLHCRGTIEAAKSRGRYTGIPTCLASHLVGGNKQCSFGCLGFGDCVKVCQFDALYMENTGLPVVKEDKCTACGKCVDVCPRNLFELHPLSQEIIVFCRSEDRGPMARKLCTAACIACGICTRACPDAIMMENNLAIITDYRKIDPEKIPEIEKCPTDAIGRIHLEEDRDEG